MPNTADKSGGFEILLLGPVEARRNGRVLPLGRRKQRALLALLALEANRVVSTDRLIDALWGETPPASASVALYGLVSGLRKSLEPDFGRLLATREPGYALELARGQIDLGRFELLASEGRDLLAAGNADGASARLTEALALWRGPPLQDVGPLPVAQAEIGRLEDSWLAVLEARIDADLARGRDGDLVPELESLVGDHPLRERLRAQLIVALYRSGRQAEALAAYRDARAALVELGLEPSDELHALEGRILRHDPELLLPAAPGAGDRAAPALEWAPPRARRRRRIVAAVAPLVAVAIVFVVAATRSSRGEAIGIASNGVGVIEHGKLVAAGTLPSSPGDIAAGAGSLWTTSGDAQTVSRIDPETGEVRQTIPVGSGASGVAADDHGVWVVNSLDGDVSRVDPGTDSVVQRISVGNAPSGIALGYGAVWVTSQGDQTLWKLDPRTGARLARHPIGAAPGAVAAGHGSLWVADEKRGVVFRVDPVHPGIVQPINVGNDPVAVAVGAGSVWVANNLDGTVSRIDPRRDSVAATISVGDGPRGIAVARDGVWVANEFDGTVALIDPRSNTVARLLHVGGQPEGVAARAGRVNVAVRSAGNAHRGGTLRLAAGHPPFKAGSLDTLNYGVAPTTILTNDGLVGFRRVGGAAGSRLVPDLAVALPTAEDGGRTYTFRLRAGIRYSNGRVVRPEDLRRALERALTTDIEVVRQVTPGYYGAIVGAGECGAAPRRCDLTRGIVTDDRTRTVAFHLTAPDPDLLYKLALPFAFAVPADTPAGDVGTHPLPATGPYMVAGYEPDGDLTLVRNPRFREWSKAAQPAGYPDRLVFSLKGSTREVVRAVENGRQDVSLEGVPRGLEQEVATQYASQVHLNPLNGVTYLFLNTKVAPFDDVRVRRAVNYAADRAAAVRVSTRGAGGLPTCQILPPDFPGFRRYCPYTVRPNGDGGWTGPDLDRARRLVAASGTAGSVVTIWEPDAHRGEAPFAASLLRSIGYRARIRRMGKAYYDPVKGPLNPRLRAQAGLYSWFADYPAPANYVVPFFSCRGFSNWSEFCDRRIEARIRGARDLQTTDPYLANRLWAGIDRAIVDRALVVPLVTLKQVDIVSKRVGNYQFHPQWGVLLDQLWVR